MLSCMQRQVNDLAQLFVCVCMNICFTLLFRIFSYIYIYRLRHQVRLRNTGVVVDSSKSPSSSATTNDIMSIDTSTTNVFTPTVTVTTASVELSDMNDTPGPELTVNRRGSSNSTVTGNNWNFDENSEYDDAKETQSEYGWCERAICLCSPWSWKSSMKPRWLERLEHTIETVFAILVGLIELFIFSNVSDNNQSNIIFIASVLAALLAFLFYKYLQLQESPIRLTMLHFMVTFAGIMLGTTLMFNTSSFLIGVLIVVDALKNFLSFNLSRPHTLSSDSDSDSSSSNRCLEVFFTLAVFPYPMFVLFQILFSKRYAETSNCSMGFIDSIFQSVSYQFMHEPFNACPDAEFGSLCMPFNAMVSLESSTAISLGNCAWNITSSA
jgi:hypothetical protein